MASLLQNKWFRLTLRQDNPFCFESPLLRHLENPSSYLEELSNRNHNNCTFVNKKGYEDKYLPLVNYQVVKFDLIKELFDYKTSEFIY